MNYMQTEYVYGSAEAGATCKWHFVPFLPSIANLFTLVLRNKFAHTLTLFFLCTYMQQWQSFFSDLFSLIQAPDQQSSSSPKFNRHVALLFFHLITEISGEVADQLIKGARSFSAVRLARDTNVRDLVRERDAATINEAVLAIVTDETNRLAKGNNNIGTNQNEVVEVVDWGVRTFGSYVGASQSSASIS